MKTTLTLSAALTLLIAGITNASVLVAHSSGPNRELSPNITGYQSNARIGLRENRDVENESAPANSYYQANGELRPRDIISSDFNSWKADATPGDDFDQEFGNDLYAGNLFQSDGTYQYKLEDLSFTQTSDDGENFYGFTNDYDNIGYDASVGRIGRDYGSDRMRGGGDDTVYVTGNGDTLVDEIISPGGTLFFDATNFGPDGSSDQERIDLTLQGLINEGSFDVTSTYEITQYDLTDTTELGTESGSVTTTIRAVPEPTSLALLSVGGLLILRRRSRRSR